MTTAIVLVNADPGKDRAVAQRLKKIKGVEGVCLVSGLYDVVATVRAGTSEQIPGDRLRQGPAASRRP